MVKVLLLALALCAAGASAQKYAAWSECKTADAGCPDGFACTETSPGYFQCRNDQLANKTGTIAPAVANTTTTVNATAAANATANATTPAAPMPSANTTAANTSTPANTSSGASKFSAWGQCDFTGASGCPQGFACVESGKGFYQCRDDQAAKATLTKAKATVAEAKTLANDTAAAPKNDTPVVPAVLPAPAEEPIPEMPEMPAADATATEEPMPEMPAMDEASTPAAEEEKPVDGAAVAAGAVGAGALATAAGALALPTGDEPIPEMPALDAGVNATGNGTGNGTAVEAVKSAVETVTVTKSYGSVAAALAAIPQLAALNSVVNASNMTGDLANPALQATVFGPNDAAVEEAQQFLGSKNKTLNETQMQELLQYHVVPGAAINSSRLAEMVAAGNGSVALKTMQGEKIIISSDAANATAGNATAEARRLRRLHAADNATVYYINEYAKILGGDVRAGKSYVHVINRVLVPESLFPFVNESAIESAPVNDTLGELPTVDVPVSSLTPEEAAAADAADAENFEQQQAAQSGAAAAAFSAAAVALPLLALLL